MECVDARYKCEIRFARQNRGKSRGRVDGRYVKIAGKGT